MHLDCFQHSFTNNNKPTISILFKYLVHLGEHISHKHFRAGSKGIHMLNFVDLTTLLKTESICSSTKSAGQFPFLTPSSTWYHQSFYYLPYVVFMYILEFWVEYPFLLWMAICFFVCERAACFYLFSIFLLSFYLFSSWLIIVLCKLNKWTFFFIMAVIVPSLLLSLVCLFCYLNFLHGKIYQSIFYISWVYVMLKRPSSFQ